MITVRRDYKATLLLSIGMSAMTMTLQAAPAVAQDSQAASSAIADIVVTAQKRSERSQDVPIAIAVLNADSLRKSGVGGTADLGTAVPGLSFPATASVAQPYLRGVGTNSIAPGDENNVAIYVDGVYIATPNASIFSLNNIAQVEVLKGPQSTLFGRNATGGVIQLITRDPTEKDKIDLQVGLGNYDTVDASFYGSTKVAAGLAADLSLYYKNQMEGWGKNLASGRDVFLGREFSARTKFLYDDGGPTKIRLGADYADGRNDFNAAFQFKEGTLPLFAPNFPYPGFYNININGTPINKTQAYGTSLSVERELGFADFVSISAYRRNSTFNLVDQDATTLPITTIFVDVHNRTLTQEFQLKSAAGSGLQWVLGLYYFNDKVFVDHFDQIDGQAQGAADGIIQTRKGFEATRSYAAFAQATAPLTPTTNLTLGARYTIDKRIIDIDASNFNPATGTLVQDLGNPASGDKMFKKPTWRISIDQRLGRDFLAYASYNRGFKSGLYNFQSPFAPDATIRDSAHLQAVRPSVLDAYEIGAKTDLFDRHVRFNVSGFYYDYKDIQINRIVPGGSILLNAAKARIKGIDADLVIQPISQFNLSMSASYLDAKFKEFPNAPTFSPNPAFIGGTSGAAIDAAGNRLPQSPQLTASASAQYDIETDFGRISLVASANYNDGYFWTVDNLVRTDSYTLVNASAAWKSKDDQLEVRLWGKNIFDTKYLAYQTQVVPFAPVTSPGAPVTYGVSLGYHF